MPPSVRLSLNRWRREEVTPQSIQMLNIATGGSRIPSGRQLVATLASALPVLLIVYYSALPSLANVIIGGLVYLLAYLTLAPLLGAVKRTDLQTLARILGQIRILRTPYQHYLRVHAASLGRT